MDDESPCLEGLPFDIQLVIFEALAPYDLFRLGQACKALSRLMSQREVWKPALKVTCKKHLLFQPSFPVNSMTADELRRSAMGPRRWWQKIARLTSMKVPLQPSSNRLIQEHEDDTAHAKLHLVPGGRYLLASTDYSVTLWDLGSPYMKPVKPCIIHSIQFNGRVTKVSNPKIHEERWLRFTAQVDMIGGRPFRLQVYEVGPLPENQVIRLLSELEIKRVGHNFSVDAVGFCDESRVAFHFWSISPRESRLVVWDFANDLLSSLHWNHSATSQVSNPSQIFVKDGLATVLEPGRVTRWAVPPFQKMTVPFSFYEALKLQPEVTSRQVFSIGFFDSQSGRGTSPGKDSTGIFGEVSRIQDASFVSRAEGTGLTFDVVWKTEVHESQSRVGLRRYKLHDTTQDSKPRLEVLSSWACSQSLRPRGFISNSGERQSRVSLDVTSTQKAAYWWDYETQFDFAIILGAMDESTEKMEWLALSLRQDVGPLQDTLISVHHSIPCLISGRIAYLTRNNDHVYADRFNEMYLLDF